MLKKLFKKKGNKGISVTNVIDEDGHILPSELVVTRVVNWSDFSVGDKLTQEEFNELKKQIE